MRNKIIFALLVVLALVLTACGSENNTNAGSGSAEKAGDNQKTEEQPVERETLDLAFEVANYDAENNALHVSIDSNLPSGTEIYRALLKDEDGRDQLIQYQSTLDDNNEIAFSLEGVDIDSITNKEYHLVFEFNVTEKTNSNLFTDKSLGGSFAEMDEFYKGSDQVLITDLGVDNAYSITLQSSNTQPVTEDVFAEK